MAFRPRAADADASSSVGVARRLDTNLSNRVAGMNGTGLSFEETLRGSREAWSRNEPEAALAAAWSAFNQTADEREATALLAKLLRFYPDKLLGERRTNYLRLLTDRNVEPDLISTAGWRLILRERRPSDADAQCENLSADFECDELVLALLRESPICFVPAERLLTRLRRWLLLSGAWKSHAKLGAALSEQARLNGGAWPFDESERGALTRQAGGDMIAAYLPNRPATERAISVDSADTITRSVAAQYEGWPYPAWTRVTVESAERLPDVIAKMDPDLAKVLPAEADMLIAGCGTGRQAATMALRYPDARITAIDVSAASLAYASRECAKYAIGNVRFLQLDLHKVGELGQRFHAVHTAGVLHHLPDPERGLKLLADVLRPGGVMHIMVYNRYQRLMVSGARKFLIADLLDKPIDDDLLREVRRRFLKQPNHPAAAYVIRSRDFATLAGTHDLLLHRHEDAFDAARVKRALAQSGLRLLSIDFPTPVVAARYDAMFPHDAQHRDIESWERFDLSDRTIGQRHYRFWCCDARA